MRPRRFLVTAASAAVLGASLTHAAPSTPTAPLAAPAAIVPLRAAYVTSERAPGRFPLSVDGVPAALYVSGADHAGVVRAVGDLRSDLARVTGTAPSVRTTAAPAGKSIVIVGTLGKSPLIDALVQSRKLDATLLRGKWEMFTTQIVEQPMSGVDRALVIAGSDKRGTIYGIYDLSAQIGVSPWHWWADVPVVVRRSLYVTGGTHTQGEPAVRYRGIFINDEAPAMSGWTHEKFGGFNAKMYTKMFELILRMKGNYLWPAMWGNAFADDDSLNAKLADEYGIVMGTSHHEPLTRAQQEWRRYGKGEWNYDHNDSTLRAFWRGGIARMGSRENIVTVGMRGDGDMPMTQGSNIALLERIVADQRTIIGEVTRKDPTETPQLWALYKEVQDYYDKGMRVPEDITLLFADDNWGNIRRLPEAKDRGRKGGFGVYYHFDYVGGPRNYKWLNTNPIARVWEQMSLAHATGANRIWIVNVGDLKPMEYPIQFFLDYAWNPEALPAAKLPDYATQWASQQFGPANAAEIADIVTTYLRYSSRRKPEMVDPETYSLTSFREAEGVVRDWDALVRRAESLEGRMPPSHRDAYYQLVLHPVHANANLHNLYVMVGRNRLYASQGRAATNLLADSARLLFERDAAISTRYNTALAGGKWRHMMDQTHIGYTYWQEPPRNTMPRVDVIQLRNTADMGVAVVELDRPPPPARGGPGGGGPPPGLGPPRPPALPTFDPFLDQTYHIDVYNRGTVPFSYAITTDVPWLRITPTTARVTTEQRLHVTVDWKTAPMGTHSAAITVAGPNDTRSVVLVTINNPASPRPESVRGFVESNGLVSMEAEHATRALGGMGVTWELIPGLGRTLSGMRAVPVTAPSVTPGGNAPRLEYDVTMFDSGMVSVHAYLSPTLNFTGAKTGVRYAVSIDDEAPQLVNTTAADTANAAWEKVVGDNIRIHVTRHRLAKAGTHTLKFWFVDPGIVLQKLVIASTELPASYLGPPESFRGIGNGAMSPRGSPAAPASSRRNVDASFAWFQYDGRDSVYATVRQGAGDYLNPILAGFYPDPAITRVGEDYYLVNSTFVYFPGIPVFHSKDLVNWTQIGNVIDRPSQLDFDTLGISRGVFAPTIEHKDGTFYVLNTCVDCGGNFIVTAKNPAGPWSDPIWLREIDGIDPAIFFDDDGKSYIINNGPPIGTPLYPGHRALWLQEFDLAAMKLRGPRKLIVNGGVDLSKKPIWIEGPHIFRKDGRYYLTAAEGGTAEGHSQVVLRADSVWGPYVPFAGNPILTQRDLPRDRAFPITSAGHANLVETPNGEWWTIFLATRPYGGDYYNTGRETFLLPVTWENGWPIILKPGQAIPYSHRRPGLTGQATPNIPMHGNFTVRDEFDGPTLAPYWNMIRTPRERWYDFTSTPGMLTLRARNQDIAKRAQPSWIGRRQQHANASASTAMRYTPTEPSAKAGLMAFQNDDYYYFLAVTLANGKPVVQLEQRMGKSTVAAPNILASAPLSAADSTIYLKITARGDKYDFHYGRREGEWTLLKGDADGTILSTRTAQGFVGVMFGLYAYSPSAR